MNCYVYIHRDVDGQAAYVGFGRGPRCLTTHGRSPEHVDFIKRSINERGLSFVELVQTGMSEGEARALEAELISTLNPTYNRSPSGETSSSAKFSNEDVARLREMFLRWRGSMRAFHETYLPEVSWSSAWELLVGETYKDA